MDWFGIAGMVYVLCVSFLPRPSRHWFKAPMSPRLRTLQRTPEGRAKLRRLMLEPRK